MNKTLLVTGLAWALSVGGAFALGRWLVPASAPAPEAAAAPVGAPGPAKTARPAAVAPAPAVAATASAAPAEAPRARTPLEALRLSARTNNPVERAALFAEALRGLNADNVEEFKAMVDAMPPGLQKMRDVSLFAYAWARFDGPAAVAYAGGAVEGPGGRMLVGSALAGWASAEPQAALAYAQSEGGTDGDFNPYMVGVLNGWATVDPAAATAYVAGLPEQDQRRYAAALAAAVMQNGLPTAMGWAESLPAGELKETALASIARQLAFQDTAEAAEFVERYAATEYGADAAALTAAQYARRDPAAASAWAAELPEGTAKARALESVAAQYARRDPAAAAEWLESLPPTAKSTDEAVAAYARGVAARDFDAALDWAQSVHDPAARSTAVVEVYQAKVRADPEAGAALVEASSLSAEEKEQALNPPRRGGQGRRGGFGGGGFFGGGG